MNDSEKKEFISDIEQEIENIKNYTTKICNEGPSKIIKDHLTNTITKIYNKYKNINETKIRIQNIENGMKYFLSNDLNNIQNDFIKEINLISNEYLKILEEIQKKINSFNKNDNIKIKKLDSLKQDISNSISFNEDNIAFILFNDIITSSFGYSSIKNKGIFEVVKSFFFDKIKIENERELLISNIKKNIRYTSSILNDKINGYSCRIIFYIRSCRNASLISFSGVQKEKWKNLCQNYDKMKNDLLNI